LGLAGLTKETAGGTGVFGGFCQAKKRQTIRRKKSQKKGSETQTKKGEF